MPTTYIYNVSNQPSAASLSASGTFDLNDLYTASGVTTVTTAGVSVNVYADPGDLLPIELFCDIKLNGYTASDSYQQTSVSHSLSLQIIFSN